MISFSEPSIAVNAKAVIREPRPKIVMPTAKLDELKLFVTMIRFDAPFEYCTIAGQSFQKFKVSPESFYVQNQGKIPAQKIAVMRLSDAQVSYIKERAKLHFFTKDGVDYCAFDFLVIELAESFNLLTYEASLVKPNKDEKKDSVSQIDKNKESLVKLQSQEKKK